MSGAEVPAAAVEAAAKVHQDLSGRGWPQWADLLDDAKKERIIWMRAALEAAAPHMQHDWLNTHRQGEN